MQERKQRHSCRIIIKTYSINFKLLISLDIEYVRSRFIKHFDGTTGSVYASPGRINLIGEHTDYNGGFVFPGAVDKGMIAEIN